MPGGARSARDPRAERLRTAEKALYVSYAPYHVLTVLFYEMADLLEIKGKSVFRVRAYARAAQNVESHAEDIVTVADRDELEKIPGVGRDLAAKITEYLTTGKIADLEAMRQEVPRGLLALLEVRGLGSKTAQLFHDRLGIDSVEKLEQATRAGDILTVPGIREKTRENLEGRPDPHASRQGPGPVYYC